MSVERGISGPGICDTRVFSIAKAFPIHFHLINDYANFITSNKTSGPMSRARLKYMHVDKFYENPS